MIGINFHDDATPQLVDYSQNALDSDRAILDGMARATAVVREIDGKAEVIGESMGSMSDGKIHRNVQSQQQVRKAWQELRDDRQERRESRRQQWQEKRADRLDRVAQRVERLKQTRAERQADRAESLGQPE